MRVLVSAALSLSLSLTSACLLERAALAQEQPPEKPAPAAARPADPDAVEYDCTVDPNVPIDADKLLQVWAERLKLPLVLDPQIAGTKVRFAQSDLKLTWALVRSVLDFHDIVVEEKDVSGRRVLFAHLRRNLNGQLAPPFRVVGDQEPLGRGDEVVAAFIQVRNGAANDIFATVRGLLVRDLNRVGNILYVKGPEIIIVVDFASNVDYYRKVVAALDLPAPPRVVKTISLVHGAAEDVAKELREIASTQSPSPNVVFDARTNKLVISGWSAQVTSLARLVEELDAPAPAHVPAPSRPASAPEVTKAPAPAPEGGIPAPWTSYAWPIATALAGLAFVRQLAITVRLYKKLGYYSKAGDPGPLSLG